jgi:pimeloyl-ACP methyl ester carboxylesterase
MRAIQRRIEASVGGALLDFGGKDALKRSKLIQRRIFLPQFGLYMNYLEREATVDCPNGTRQTSTSPPTLLFCHGLSDEAKNLASFIHSLSVPGHVRILVPDQIGHGVDLDRAKSDPTTYEHPTPLTMLASTSEFLDVVQVGTNCHAFGISLGGALVYYLQHKRPHVIQKSILVSPALRSCIGRDFIDDFVQERKRHMCFEERRDVKILFRDLSTINRTRKNPVPKFFLEAIYRNQQRRAPEGHFKEMVSILIQAMDDGTTTQSSSTNEDPNHVEGENIFHIDHDTDAKARRLVLWPAQDYVCNHDSGKRFFENSSTTVFETIPDCGHVFHSDGSFILDLVRARVVEYLLDFAPVEVG